LTGPYLPYYNATAGVSFTLLITQVTPTVSTVVSVCFGDNSGNQTFTIQSGYYQPVTYKYMNVSTYTITVTAQTGLPYTMTNNNMQINVGPAGLYRSKTFLNSYMNINKTFGLVYKYKTKETESKIKVKEQNMNPFTNKMA
jgi:hypothetical protein